MSSPPPTPEIEPLAKRIALFAGPVTAMLLYFSLSFTQHSSQLALTAAITLWCAIWWVFEPIPIPVTSLLPLALFPLVGILSAAQVAGAYGHPLILLLLGGFLLSTAMASSGAHRRLALLMVNAVGSHSPRRIIAGFMIASAVLSMWISNTATTLMLLPVAMATLADTTDKKLVTALLLGVAYAASLGGIATPIGTPPNLIFMSAYKEATGSSITFIDWMSWGLPLVALFLPLMIFWMARGLTASHSVDLPRLGQWTPVEKRVLMVFAFTALAWITRQNPWGGWSSWLNLPTANDASVALLAVVAMFLIPSGNKQAGASSRLLDWPTANRIPWGVLLLFGGGICIARAFNASGLSQLLGEQLSALSALPAWLMVLLICLIVTFMTEVTSNTATTALLMPILAATAVATNLPFELLMIPATMSASCAFMLPVATAPNAVVYGSQAITIDSMMRKGFVLNLIGAASITLICVFFFT